MKESGFEAQFEGLVERQFGTSPKTAAEQALHLDYPYRKMVKLALLHRQNREPFLDVQKSEREGATMSLKEIFAELRAILDEEKEEPKK